MRLYIILLISLLSVSFSSCKKSTFTPSSSIIGKWSWVQTQGGIAGATYSPSRSGYQMTVEYFADSTYKRYKNNALVDENKFTIIKEQPVYSSYRGETIKMGNLTRTQLIRNDTLFQSDLNISDGYSDVYVRMH